MKKIKGCQFLLVLTCLVLFAVSASAQTNDLLTFHIGNSTVLPQTGNTTYHPDGEYVFLPGYADLQHLSIETDPSASLKLIGDLGEAEIFLGGVIDLTVLSSNSDGVYDVNVVDDDGEQLGPISHQPKRWCQHALLDQR